MPSIDERRQARRERTRALYEQRIERAWLAFTKAVADLEELDQAHGRLELVRTHGRLDYIDVGSVRVPIRRGAAEAEALQIRPGATES